MEFTQVELFNDTTMTEAVIEKPEITPRSFSVVLPYYNEADFLENTLLSWLNQKRTPDQIILIDNGSTDGSETVARQVLKDTDSIEVKFLHRKCLCYFTGAGPIFQVKHKK